MYIVLKCTIAQWFNSEHVTGWTNHQKQFQGDLMKPHPDMCSVAHKVLSEVHKYTLLLKIVNFYASLFLH